MERKDAGVMEVMGKEGSFRTNCRIQSALMGKGSPVQLFAEEQRVSTRPLPDVEVKSSVSWVRPDD
jgi:hypothetical protein